MIEGINITKRFEELTLFEDYNFRIEDQEFVCFSGASGTGKTTLLNMIGLIEPIDAGSLRINSIEYRTNKQKMEYFRSVVGFLFQNFALIENKTVKQNLELIRRGSRTSYTIEEVLERVGLKSKLYSKVYTLSGGEQQRIALARLFLKKCEIILADEPTGSLDAKNAQIIMDMLLSLNAEGKTVIIVTHDQKIKDRAGRVIEL
ncbi:putative ABC transport system ATP-binding protein [Desulfitobacterium sp. LBE]|uniref:ATP-binding cassette domain-containing protein n=1 Tax=Desulfitobacterium sp. LBE TaxID=884086 RepID=UPI00119C8A5D|nr:ATP-binding cassette domain-containing protein [Desulfitobacterium sp. LBE]TWH55981.1 putative ABC transport system ATP-binding protein [Desulfitobacterium sp. LBE]